MKQTKSLNSRRSFLKKSALGLGAISAASLVPMVRAKMLAGPVASPHTNTKRSASEISAWYTDAKQRFTAGQPITWQDSSVATVGVSMDSVRIVPNNKFQDILGFGGCLTDASCYVIQQLRQPLREQLLHELFHP